MDGDLWHGVRLQPPALDLSIPRYRPKGSLANVQDEKEEEDCF